MSRYFARPGLFNGCIDWSCFGMHKQTHMPFVWLCSASVVCLIPRVESSIDSSCDFSNIQSLFLSLRLRCCSLEINKSQKTQASEGDLRADWLFLPLQQHKAPPNDLSRHPYALGPFAHGQDVLSHPYLAS